MRVLVTGAAGFVGGHLIPRLEAEGASVEATDREVDVSDAGAVEELVARVAPDAVIHLAAQSSIAASWREPALTFRVNFLGARCVLAALERRAPSARLLLVGSGDQYGTAKPGAPAFRESDPLRPPSPYSRTKAAADLLGADFARRGLDVVRVRAFNHAGPGQSDAFVLSSFARQTAEMESGLREPLLRVGNLDSVRDFLDIADVVDAYVRLLDPTAAPAGVYNVASGVGGRIGDLLDALLSHARVRPRVEVDPERVRPTDLSVGDASRLREATGWAPRVPFERTIESALSDWRARLRAA